MDRTAIRGKFSILTAIVAGMLSWGLIGACAEPASSPRAPTTPAPSPQLTVPSSGFSLDEVLQDTPVRLSVEVGNAGPVPLVITRLVTPPFLSQSGEPTPLTVPPNKTAIFEFSADTNKSGRLVGNIQLITNDPRGSVKTVPVFMSVLPVTLTEEERKESYLEMVSVEQPMYVSLEDLGRSQSLVFGWPFLLGIREEWSFKLSNPGPGKATGTLAVKAEGFLNNTSHWSRFALDSGDAQMLSLTLDPSFIATRLLPRQYTHEFQELQEEVRKERDVIDIVKVVKGERSVLDTFPKESGRAGNWKRGDYYSPAPLCKQLDLNANTLVDCAPGSTSGAAVPPTGPQAPVSFGLVIQSSGIQRGGLLDSQVSTSVSAVLTNTGDFDAHNVIVTVRATTASGRGLTINGRQREEIPIGLVSAHQSVEKQIRLTIGLDLQSGLEAQNSGIRITVTVSSSERSQDFYYTCTQQQNGCKS